MRLSFDLSIPPLPWPRGEAPPPSCYVYAVLIDGVRRYVGQGRGRRAFVHLQVCRERSSARIHRAMRQARQLGQEVGIEVLAAGLAQADALELETTVIAKLGRAGIDRDGLLFNKAVPTLPRQAPPPAPELPLPMVAAPPPPSPPRPAPRGPSAAPGEQLVFLDDGWAETLLRVAGPRPGESALTASLRRVLQDPANLHDPLLSDSAWSDQAL